jgi:hypothetical protein
LPIFIGRGAPEIHPFLRLLGRRCVAGALLPLNLEDKRPPSYRANERTRPTKAKPQMSERLETLKKARERMTEDRDAFAKTLAAPFDRDKAERARTKFIETQVLIDALDRAIAGEQQTAAAAA